MCVAVQGSGSCTGHQQLLQQAAPRGCSPEHQGECDSLQPYVSVETCCNFYIVSSQSSSFILRRCAIGCYFSTLYMLLCASLLSFSGPIHTNVDSTNSC